MLYRLTRMLWSWWTKPASFAVSYYYASRSMYCRLSGRRKRAFLVLYKVVHPLVEAWSGVSLPVQANVGPGLRIYHRGKVVVNEAAVLGDRCSIVHGVTIGNRTPGGGCPTIGSDVQIGAYAQILGPVTIGDSAKIGSLALVVKDVPAGATVKALAAVIETRRDPSRSA